MVGLPRAPRVLVCIALFAGCHAWRPVTVIPVDSVRIASSVRIERLDGTRTTFANATIRRDTVIGRFLQDGAPPREVRIPRDSVRRISARGHDPVRSAALGVGLYAGVGVVAALVTVLVLLSGGSP
ncbi:MAG: hypothetical protein MUF21_12890 [Gemmatimonadaceae bacterium]|jgi:hypothetical protein|nr:hypothetical protein [Gemmatimonadaceae bacterium]